MIWRNRVSQIKLGLPLCVVSIRMIIVRRCLITLFLFVYKRIESIIRHSFQKLKKMNKKFCSHIRGQLNDLKRLRDLTNTGLSDNLQQKMKNQAKKKFHEVQKSIEKKGLDSNWLETNFQISLEDLKTTIDEM